MKLIKHNIWDCYSQGFTICIPTNPIINSKGEAVMGRGLAFDAAQRIPTIKKEFAEKLIEYNKNIPILFEQHRIITFPTKHHWKEKSDLELIKKSCDHLNGLVDFLIPHVYNPKKGIVFLPLPGCGNGQLKKEEVMPILEEKFKNQRKVVIIEKE